MKNHNKSNIFDKIKNQKNYGQITKILIEIIETITRKNNNYILKKYFDKWRNYINKDNNRLDALLHMLEIFEVKNIKNSANCLSNVFTLNKLMKDIEKILALNFLRNSKNKGKKDNLYRNLTNNLIDAKDDLTNQNKKLIKEKIFKM